MTQYSPFRMHVLLMIRKRHPLRLRSWYLVWYVESVGCLSNGWFQLYLYLPLNALNGAWIYIYCSCRMVVIRSIHCRHHVFSAVLLGGLVDCLVVLLEIIMVLTNLIRCQKSLLTLWDCSSIIRVLIRISFELVMLRSWPGVLSIVVLV